jgi:hypothetical protein
MSGISIAGKHQLGCCRLRVTGCHVSPAVSCVCEYPHVGQAEAAQAHRRAQLGQVVQRVAVQLHTTTAPQKNDTC